MNNSLIQSLVAAGADAHLGVRSGQQLRLLWGVAPTGRIHIGYAGYISLLQRLKAEDTQTTVVLANYHGYLDSNKTDWDALDQRTLAYRDAFAQCGFTDVIETKQFYRQPEYIEALFRFSAFCALQETLAAGHGTLRAAPSEARLSDLLYVATQVLDVHMLNINVVMCGMDESPIYRFGLPLLQKVYGCICGHIYLPMCPGLTSREMHASDAPANNIFISDDVAEVRVKVEVHCKTSKVPAPLLSYCIQTLFLLADRPGCVARLRAIDPSDLDRVSLELSECLSELLKQLRSS